MTTDKPWLGIDTATDHAGFAIVSHSEVLAAHTQRTRRGHTTALAPRLNQSMRDLGISAADLGGVAVAIGPGSYTGLRVGLSLAKGLAYAAGLELVGVATLDAIAAPLSPPHVDRDRTLWAVVRAGRGRVVGAAYARGVASVAPEGLQPASFDDMLGAAETGDWIAGEVEPGERDRAVARGLRVLPAVYGAGRAAWIAELGRERAVVSASDGEARFARLTGLEPAYPISSGGSGP